MKRLRIAWRVASRFLRGQCAGLPEITSDYDAAASTYDATWRAFMSPVNQAVLAHLHLPPGGHLVDLGCGTGLVLDHLASQGSDFYYLGIDASPGMLARAQARAQAEWRLGDAHRVLESLPPGSADAITALWSWEYMDRARILPRMRRVLRPGGRLLLLANRRATLPEMERAYLDLMSHPGTRVRKVFPLQMRMPRDARQMAAELARHGFQVNHQGDGEQVRSHGTPTEAIAWGFRTGALAGTRCIFDGPDLEARLGAVLAPGGSGSLGWTTTHRFCWVAGSCPC